MTFNFMVPLRAAQELFAIIVLALDAYVASWYNGQTTNPSPSQINYFIFVGIWTAALAVPYLTISPRFFPTAAHKFGILAAEAVTMLFWFAGFIAAATFMANLGICRGTVCHAAQASVVFAAFTWVLFVATTVMAVIYVFRTQNTSRTKRTMEVHHNVI